MADITDPSIHSTTDDARELHRFGYQQQLKRSMGSFSSFAISFSLISIITGIFANFGYGIKLIGPYILWSWALVGAGQFLVALVMADLSTRYPLSGYGYQWSSRLFNPHFGYFVGWLLLMQFLTGFPGVCRALADTVYNVITDGVESDWTITGITVAVITLITIIHLYGIRIVSFTNDLGVFAEISGVLAIIFILFGLYFLSSHFDLSDFVLRLSDQKGSGPGFSAFALSLLMGAWCLTGFEAAADLAEETHQPRDTVPRAVIISQLSAAVGGFLLLLALIISVTDWTLVKASESPLIYILHSSLGSHWMSLIGLIVILSILACGVASMATATRLIYSMARDNILPFSSHLNRVHEKFRVPRAAVWLVWAVSVLCVILLRHLELITSISAVAGYLGYAGIIFATIFSSTFHRDGEHGFSLGKLRKPVQIISLFWTLVVVSALTIPATYIHGFDETHLPAKSTLVAILFGIVVYFILIRKKITAGNAGPPDVRRESK
jgi:amino acid transporter